MATHRTIASTETDPEAPETAQLFKALADNPIAMFEGASGAPRLFSGAFERLVAGTDIRLRKDAEFSTASTSGVGTGIDFDLLQGGTLRLACGLKKSGSGGTTSTLEIKRTRAGTATIIATLTSTSDTYEDKTADFSVIPGDSIIVTLRTPFGTAYVNNLRIQTAGQDLMAFGGAAGLVESNRTLT